MPDIPLPHLPPRTITSVWPAVLLLAVAAGMFVWSRSYSETAARFPSIVAGVMVLLAGFDIWSRTRLPGAAAMTAFWGAGFSRREMDHDPPIRTQATILAWIAGCFVLMAAVGILAASPLFCAAYLRVQGRRSWRAALIAAAAVLLFQFAVFEWLLDYELYRGLPFTRGGIAAW